MEFELEAKTIKEWIEYACGPNISVSDYFQCHRNKSYSRAEIINNSIFDFEEVELGWNEMFQLADYGVCQTAVPQIKINSSSKFLVINLNPSLPYKIFLHDPKLFFLSVNPRAFHRVQMSYSKESKFMAQMLEASRMKLFNRPSSPCQEDPEYNFTACLINFVHENAGCQFEHCSTMEDIYNYLNKWSDLMFENDKYIQR